MHSLGTFLLEFRQCLLSLCTPTLEAPIRPSMQARFFRVSLVCECEICHCKLLYVSKILTHNFQGGHSHLRLLLEGACNSREKQVRTNAGCGSRSGWWQASEQGRQFALSRSVSGQRAVDLELSLLLLASNRGLFCEAAAC